MTSSHVRQIVFVLLMLASASMARATTYYTSTAGDDRRDCATAQNISTPKRSINAGVACLSAGDTLLVRAGTYNEGLSSVPSGTSWSVAVRIAAYPSETVWLQPTSSGTSAGGIGSVIWLDCNCHYIEFDGINVNSTALVGTPIWFSTNNGNNPHHIRYKNAEVSVGASGGSAGIALGAHTAIGATGSNEVQHVTIHGGGTGALCGYQCASGGVYVEGPNNLVEDCDIYDTGGWAVQIYNSSGDSPDTNIIRRNRLHDITRRGDIGQMWGVLVSGNNNQVYDNLIYGIGTSGAGDGIDLYSGTGHLVANNTIYNVVNRAFDVCSGCASNTIRNNIAYQYGTSIRDNSSGITQDHNLFGTNPNFVNAGSGDFHLQAGSAAIDTGITIAAVTSDKDGVARPKGAAYDIGAYEYCTSGCGTAPPPTPTNLRITAATANAQVNAIGALLNSGFLDLYTVPRPDTADTAVTTQMRVASLTLNATAFASAVSGVASSNAIGPDANTANAGTVAWFRAWKADHTTPVFDGNIDRSGADLNLSQTFIASHSSVSLSGLTLSVPLQVTTSGGHIRLTNLAANTATDTLCVLLNSGFLDVYDGTQPTTADTAITTQIRLASMPFSATACGASSAGVATANAITADTDADATGTATWFRAWKSDHTTKVLDGSVGTSSGDLRLATTTIAQHDTVSISTFTVTTPKQ